MLLTIRACPRCWDADFGHLTQSIAEEPRPVGIRLSEQILAEALLLQSRRLGHTLQLDHRKFKIVGVAAPRFAWGDGDVYLPLKLMRDPGRTPAINLLLRPGVSPAAADAALQPLVEQFASYMPQDFPDASRQSSCAKRVERLGR